MTYPFISASLEASAKGTGVGVKQIREASDSGDLPVYWAGNKRIYRAADLDEWIQTLPTERPRADQ
jgi:hypothetical protein